MPSPGIRVTVCFAKVVPPVFGAAHSGSPADLETVGARSLLRLLLFCLLGRCSLLLATTLLGRAGDDLLGAAAGQPLAVLGIEGHRLCSGLANVVRGVSGHQPDAARSASAGTRSPRGRRGSPRPAAARPSLMRVSVVAPYVASSRNAARRTTPESSSCKAAVVAVERLVDDARIGIARSSRARRGSPSASVPRDARARRRARQGSP